MDANLMAVIARVNAGGTTKWIGQKAADEMRAAAWKARQGTRIKDAEEAK